MRADGSEAELFPATLRSVHAAPRSGRQNRFKLFGGYLERVMAKKTSPLRQHLVWKNFYYGSYSRKVIRRFPERATSAIPTHFVRPELFAELDGLVHFSTEVRRWFGK